jgi:Domain of unknown function (DUF1830)
MIQPLSSLSKNKLSYLLCCYVNSTSSIQIARISNIDNWYLERVVFPGQRLLFDAPVEAQLEIYSGAIANSILVERILCQNLQVETSSTEELIIQNY